MRYSTEKFPFPSLKRFAVFVMLGIALFLAGCDTTGQDAQSGQTQKPVVVTTTGMIMDAVRQIAGNWVEVEALMGPGVDPHLYKATQGDLSRLRSADMIFYNGLHLEGKMGDILEKLGRQKPVIAVSDGVPTESLIQSANFADAIDPHIWFDVSIWTDAVRHLGKELAATFPEIADSVKVGTDRYIRRLTVLHQWVGTEIQKIPSEKRIMITAHDAFEYFGRAYGIEVQGLQGISTVSEYGLQDISNLVKMVTAQKIPAIFVESSVPRKSLEAVVEGCRQRDHEVRIGGTLFSDAMGASDTPEGTYEGMVRWNVNTLVENLK